MKAHCQALDGLRGVAAISVVIFHIFELMVPDLDHNPLPHTFLAVDFFFALSGYVLGYAYDGRLGAAASGARLSVSGFIKRRLIRLHPVVVVAAIVGAVVYLCDPNVGDAQRVGVALSPVMMALTVILSLFLLPSPPLPNLFGETHSVNPPSWTLFWEYIANLFFVSYGYRLKRSVHVVLLVCGAVALMLTAVLYKGDLGYGWGWSNVWVAPVRLCYPFLAGLLVYRLGLKITLPQPFIAASVLLLAVFFAPRFGVWNGVYEAGAVILAFPLILMIGASVTRVPGPSGAICRFIGGLSYPLYIIHYPFVLLFGHWNWQTHPTQPLLYTVAAGLVVFEIALATVLYYGYDLPVRAALTRRFLGHRTPGSAASAFRLKNAKKAAIP